MAFEATLATSILNWLLRAQPMPAAPTELWIGLHSGSRPAGNNEVSGSVGGRVKIDPSFFTAVPTAVAGVTAMELLNTKAISFGTAQTAVNIFTFTLWKTQAGITEGDLMMSGDVIPDVALRIGDPALFSVGDLIVRVG